LFDNLIETLPPETGKLKNLEVLNVSNNPLRHLPGEMAKMRNLLWFVCKNTHLPEVPPEISPQDDGIQVIKYILKVQKSARL